MWQVPRASGRNVRTNERFEALRYTSVEPEGWTPYRAPMAAKKKSAKKPAKSAKKKGIRPQRGGKGPTKGEPECGNEHGVHCPDCACTRVSGHETPKHRNRENKHRWD